MTDTALVLCAGFGSRLGELTRELPKPLLPIEGRPLLDYTLEHLKAQGIERVFINLHYRGDMIREAIGDGQRLGLEIQYVEEAVPLGTAGSAREIEPLLGPAQDLLVVYGDLLTDQPLAPLRAAHAEHLADASLLVHRRAGSNSRLSLDDEGRIRAFAERPADDAGAHSDETWVNSGFQLLSRRLCRALSSTYPLDLPRDVYAPGVDSLRLWSVPLSGYRCAIDSPQRYEEACAAVREGRVFG